MVQVITEADVRAAQRKKTLVIPERALVTDLAREAALRLGVELLSRPKVRRMPHVLGNWKMNLDVPSAVALLQRLASHAELADCGAAVAVLPPHPYLVLASALLEGTSIGVGAQDAHHEQQGAYTGDVSVKMITGMCQYLLAGHSERRQGHGESSELVWKKAATGLAAGLKLVVCVGESAQQRERGKTFSVLRDQLAGVAKAVSPETAQRLLVAYEPIWAIGTGKRANLEQIEEAHREIRRQLLSGLGPAAEGVPILYGGSVQADGAAELAKSVHVDGFLVGGASLDDASFVKIAGSFRERCS